MTPGELSDRLLEFAARTGKIVDALPDSRLARHIAGLLPEKQLAQVLDECTQLCNILGKSVVTARGLNKTA